jgi:cell division protein FtsN
MAKARSVDPSERLPWLSDTSRPQPRQPRRSPVPLLISISAAGAIAFAGWSAIERRSEPAPAPVLPARTVPLPPPSPSASAGAEPQAPTAAEREALQPETEPAATRPAEPPRAKASRSKPKAATSAKPKPSQSPKAPAAVTPAYEPKAWNSGVRGRIIQLGAFRTSAQAQAEWRRVYSRYPLLRPLSPRVLKSRVRGRTFYRLQLGTFSHAHSELLCQRLRTLGEGCMVLGLPRRGRER